MYEPHPFTVWLERPWHGWVSLRVCRLSGPDATASSARYSTNQDAILMLVSNKAAWICQMALGVTEAYLETLEHGPSCKVDVETLMNRSESSALICHFSVCRCQAILSRRHWVPASCHRSWNWSWHDSTSPGFSVVICGPSMFQSWMVQLLTTVDNREWNLFFLYLYQSMYQHHPASPSLQVDLPDQQVSRTEGEELPGPEKWKMLEDVGGWWQLHVEV